ncbi:unnamed protein product [Adineta ricciae]|uniref:EGF-like domain-containing protein n=1 Tax=Adineta ricciae TaxID=249248 RepID=A0A813R2G8_ADIRI|nr:unnamed protein product [Adineta ricciae]
MYIFILCFFLITINVHGKCTNETCLYGHCSYDKCICDPGIYGQTCNKDIQDCGVDSCLNNSTCIELVNGFACQCSPNFYGSRCQYYRREYENFCTKKCLNNGKCIVINSIERCSCLPTYFGAQCEHKRSRNQGAPLTQKCSLLKRRSDHDETTCIAIALTPIFDVHCECHWSLKSQNRATCQITPSPYSIQKCSFNTSVTMQLSSTLPEPIQILVCPINWEILDQYKTTEEKLNSVYMARCQLYSI